jgi:hypothetical protein
MLNEVKHLGVTSKALFWSGRDSSVASLPQNDNNKKMSLRTLSLSKGKQSASFYENLS